jgi:outer membrane protein insertion porin family
MIAGGLVLAGLVGPRAPVAFAQAPSYADPAVAAPTPYQLPAPTDLPPFQQAPPPAAPPQVTPKTTPTNGSYFTPVADPTKFALPSNIAGATPETLPPPGGGPVPSGDSIVREVRVEGNRTTPVSKLPQLRTRVGEPFDSHIAQEDVRALASSRKFLDVRSQLQPVPGGIAVIFQVVERPTLEYVTFVGNQDVGTKTLRKKSELEPKQPLDPYAVEEGRRKVEAYYKEKGYNHAVVTTTEGTKPNDHGAVFMIDEGQQEKIWWVSFEGNTIASDARLRTQIDQKQGILWLFGGKVDRKKIDDDVQKLYAYYRGLGFFKAKIAPDLAYNEAHSWLSIKYIIDEGPRYTIRSVSFIGNEKFKVDELNKNLELVAGKPFVQASLDRDRTGIGDVYGTHGYIFADVQAETQLAEDKPQMDLVYHCTEGRRYRVGQININIGGETPHTNHLTIMDRMSLRPGDIVNTKKLRDDERRLKFSSLFNVDPQKGSPPKITFTKPDEDKEESLAQRDDKGRGRKSGTPPSGPAGGFGRSGDRYSDGSSGSPAGYGEVGNYRGQSPDDEIVVDVSETKGPSGEDVVVFTPSNRGAAQPRFQSPGGGYDAWGNYSGGQDDGSRAAWGIPSGNTGSSYLPPSARPLPAGSVTSSPSMPQQYSAPPLGATPAPAASPYSNAVYSTQPVPGRGVSYQNAPPAADSAAPWTSAPAAPPASTAPPFGQYQQPVYQPPTAANGPVYPPPGPTPQYTPQPSAPAFNSSPAYPSGGGNAFGQGYVPSGAAPPFVTAPAPTQPQPGAIGSEPFQLFNETDPSVPLYVQANETTTGRLMIGAGYNSDAGLIGNFTFDEQNFDITRLPHSWEDISNGTAWRGDGERLRIEAQPGTLVQRYAITYQVPYIFHSQAQFDISGFYFTRIYRDWDEGRVGGKLGLGYAFTPDLTGRIGFDGERVNIYNPHKTVSEPNPNYNPADPNSPPTILVPTPELERVLGQNDRYGFSVGLSHDTRDSPFLPTQGHLISANFEEVVGTFVYPRFDLEARQYFLLHQRADGSGRHVLGIGGEIGITGDNTPIYDNFFAGGFSTIRGFAFRGASPVIDNVQVGGQFMALGTAEYMFPITADDALRAVVFCDFGTVEQNIALNGNQFRCAPGVGLRINVPAMGPAPIALDLAFPVAKAKTDEIQNFAFFIGVAR